VQAAFGNLREPFPAFVDARAEVAAVLALGCDVLVAFEEGREVCGTKSVIYSRSRGLLKERTVCAASKDESHGESCAVLCCRKGRDLGALFRGDWLS
jgi:hypothetical protein